MQRQPIELQTLYAELVEQLVALDAQRAIGHLGGSFVTKTVKGREYYYLQHLDPGGVRRQVYLGPRDDALDAALARFSVDRESGGADAASARRLATLLRAGGALVTDAPSFRVVRAFANAGVFATGGVLVGTHAFLALGNMLGVVWQGSNLRTQDIDLATESSLGLAVPADPADILGVLEGLEMGFLPVPGLNRTSPSTSFKVRGQGLRVDLLTPARSDSNFPVEIPRLRACAQPLKFLDYLIETPVRAALIGGTAVLVNVPDPARFALHKLILSGERPVTAAAKREKDLTQAGQLLEVLIEDRPGDVEVAWAALKQRGPGWTKRVVPALERLSPAVAEEIEQVTKG